LYQLISEIEPNLLNKTEQIFYVYALLDTSCSGPWVYEVCDKKISFPFKPFYIGKGKAGRKDMHVRCALAGKGTTAKAHKIRKIYASGNEVIAKATRKLYTEAEALALEILLIDSIGRRDLGKGPLTNLANGGEGPSGCKRTKAQREFNRQRGINWWNGLSVEEKARHSTTTFQQFARMSEEDRQARALVISEASKAVHASRTPEQKRKWSQSITDTHWSKDTASLVYVSSKLAATWASKSATEMQERTRKYKESMTPDKQKARALKIQLEYASRTPEQKAARVAKINATKLRNRMLQDSKVI
jgi:hypothetical protein